MPASSPNYDKDAALDALSEYLKDIINLEDATVDFQDDEWPEMDEESPLATILEQLTSHETTAAHAEILSQFNGDIANAVDRLIKHIRAEL